MKENLEKSIDFLNKKIGIKSSFSVPENYFSELEASISSEISTSSFSKDTGFTTPNDYFNNLEDSILNSISAPQRESKIIHFRSKILKTYLG